MSDQRGGREEGRRREEEVGKEEGGKIGGSRYERAGRSDSQSVIVRG